MKQYDVTNKSLLAGRLGSVFILFNKKEYSQFMYKVLTNRNSTFSYEIVSNISPISAGSKTGTDIGCELAKASLYKATFRPSSTKISSCVTTNTTVHGQLSLPSLLKSMNKE